MPICSNSIPHHCHIVIISLSYSLFLYKTTHILSSHFPYPKPYHFSLSHITYKTPKFQSSPKIQVTVIALNSLDKPPLFPRFILTTTLHFPLAYLALKQTPISHFQTNQTYTCYIHCKTLCQRQIHHMSKNMRRKVT